MKKSIVILIVILIVTMVFAETNTTNQKNIEFYQKMTSAVDGKTVCIGISLNQDEENIQECRELTPLLIGIMSTKGWKKADDNAKVSENLIIFIDENNEIQMTPEKP